MSKKPEYVVHLIESPAGQAALAVQKLSTRDLARAIAEFQKREGVRIGTLIGVNQNGFFGSAREGWRPDQPDAFSKPLINIPWVQILELLNEIPDGTTGQFLASGGNRH
ncbi:hypothetical protein MTBLM1_70008 [Rhodospirillaceae bacterium LM-1]|nr:hypothetical protein MTBLM1_70008 [Rhodospirillaceae bacterium LM-1]